MCHWNEKTVDHLLLYCPVAHSLWVYMLQIFGIHWVMLGSMESLVYCWSFWLGKFNSDMEYGSQLFDVDCLDGKKSPRNPWFNYKLFARRLYLIGLGVGASRNAPPS